MSDFIENEKAIIDHFAGRIKVAIINPDDLAAEMIASFISSPLLSIRFAVSIDEAKKLCAPGQSRFHFCVLESRFQDEKDAGIQLMDMPAACPFTVVIGGEKEADTAFRAAQRHVIDYIEKHDIHDKHMAKRVTALLCRYAPLGMLLRGYRADNDMPVLSVLTDMPVRNRREWADLAGNKDPRQIHDIAVRNTSLSAKNVLCLYNALSGILMKGCAARPDSAAIPVNILPEKQYHACVDHVIRHIKEYRLFAGKVG